MKKLSALVLALSLLFGLAQAESLDFPYYFTGQVSAGQEHPLMAPMSGSISNIFIKQNLMANKGDSVLEITPNVATSPIDGVVGSIIAKEGDNLNSLKEIYKAVMYIDQQNQGIAKCSHVHAAKPYEYQVAILGEKVWLQNRTDTTQTGEGEVIAREGKTFTVRMTSGNIRYDSKIYVYRSPKFESFKRLGGGTLRREAPVPVNADGYMVKLLVQPGDKVKSGDPLFFYTSKFAYDYQGPKLIMPENGIITKLDKKLSEKVEGDDVIGAYILNNEKFITAKVSEVEANAFNVGDELLAEAVGETKPLPCTVQSIAAIPDDKGLYDMQLLPKEPLNLRIGSTLSFSGTLKRSVPNAHITQTPKASPSETPTATESEQPSTSPSVSPSEQPSATPKPQKDTKK